MKAIFYTLTLAFLAIIYSCSQKTADAVSSVPREQRDGSSFEKAIVITAKTERAAVKAERWALSKRFPGYQILCQNRADHDAKPFDVIKIRTLDDKERSIYFNISLFFRK